MAAALATSALSAATYQPTGFNDPIPTPKPSPNGVAKAKRRKKKGKRK